MSDNVGVIRGLYEAFGRGDVGAVLGTFDPNIEWLEAEGFVYAGGNPYIGPMAVAQGVFQQILADSDGFSVTPQHFIGSGDAVVVEGRYKCTVKRTGRAIDAQFAHVWRLAGGKIVRFQQYTDTAQWKEAFGA